MNSENPWLQPLQQMQQTALQQWQQMLQALPNAFTGQGLGAMPAAPGFDLKDVLNQIAGEPVKIDPSALLEIQQNYLKELTALWSQGMQVQLPKDPRFAGDAWSNSPVSAFAAAQYLLNARTLMAMAEAIDADAKTKGRLMFAVQQWVDASAPSNFFAFNAEAQKKALETKGESISKGIHNLLADMQKGRVSMTDDSAFEVGKNVGTSEGRVVFRNEIIELIEYKPLTPKVHQRPFVMVPASINKFYILDLQPQNSLVRYAVEQGFHTFIVSWRNPDLSCADKTWDDYIEDGVIKAMSVAKDISGADAVNALGFCVGGTMLGTALGVLAARKEKLVASATLLTVLLDFTHTGTLGLFIDQNFVRFREIQFANGGLMPGRELATVFNFLRPNDLVWNYVVGNYLKGETPPPFDLLYWNSDSTNLPGPYFSWYLRNTYLENRLVQPGSATVCGEKIDLNKIDIPMYIYGSREDHIVPIAGAYATTQLIRSPKRFVMGASGHIAGVINPASKNKRSHWISDSDEFPADVDEWIAQSTEVPGSWWTDWSEWLKGQSGKLVAAPKTYGNRQYKPLDPAPGTYVLAKA